MPDDESPMQREARQTRMDKRLHAAFERWWGSSLAQRGQGGLSRRQVAEMAYGAGAVTGAEKPELVVLEKAS